MDVNARVQNWLETYGGASVSAAEFLCDRHLDRPERAALIYEDGQGNTISLSYQQLHDQSAALAGFFRDLGVEKGSRVAGLLPKGVELVLTTLAAWRLGAVYIPLFTAFGPQGVEYRLKAGEASVIVTDETNRSKLKEIPGDAVSGLKTVTVTNGDASLEPGDSSFWTALERASPVTETATVSGDEPMILIFTSGTTGNPKGVPVPVKALASFEAYMRFGLDVRDEDVYWNMADPGWAYGLYYNLIGPLLLGKTILFYGGAFTPQEAYRVMHQWQVTNFASAPTAYRALMAAGDEPLQEYRPRLRVASSAGEPLNPEVINWAQSRFGVPIHDHYGQTELGMIINNHHLPEIRNELKPGSMGLGMPGFRAVVVDESGRELGPGQEGQLAIDTQASHLNWFSGYWKDEARTMERYTQDGKYCLTGDTISRDSDGYFFFSGRSDDIILSAGYRIGPFEVESVLMQHPDVTETAVIGVPDQLRGEVVKAYVVLQQGRSGSEELAEELTTMVKEKLSKHEYPREIEFVAELPKTPSGKIQRFLLRQSR